MSKKHIFILLLFIFSKISIAQQRTFNQNFWFQYIGKFELSKKINFNLEYNNRQADYFSTKQQWLVRPSFDYALTKKLNFAIGYTYFSNYTYGNPSLNKTAFKEEQFYLQLGLIHTFNKLKFSHRLRNEFRYIDDVVKISTNEFEVNGNTYRNRLRYMLTTSYPIWIKNNENKLSLQLGNEVFMGVSSNSGKRFITQNRIFSGLNYLINKYHQLQLNYVHQEIFNNNLTIHETNPTVRITYITNFKLYKEKK